MSTIDRPEPRVLPPLVAGQRLDQPTFHDRYEAMPPNTRAELIGGVVFMPSPLSFGHGSWDSNVSDWLGHYRRFTKGIGKAINATVQFDDYGEPQPDCQLRIPEELGGLSRLVDGYVVGTPELVVEVGKSSRRIDLGPKKTDYQRAGVPEYLFVGMDPNEILWFVRRAGRFAAMNPGEDGILRSEVFPGLWLDPSAMLSGDTDRVFEVLDQGLASPEHAAFVARLAAAQRPG